MPSIGLLHLTDFHQGMGVQKTLWPNVKESFLDDLARLHEKAGPWDLVLFTGDLTQRGSREEFEALDATLKKVWERLSELGSKPALLAVPGNHDLQRPQPSPALDILATWHTHPTTADAFFSARSNPGRTLVQQAFEEYMRWWLACPIAPGLELRHGELPGDFAATFTKDGLRLAVVGLNSSFLHLRDGMREGELDVDMRQMTKLLDDPTAWLRNHHAALLLTHHPIEWLHATAQSRFRAEINPPGRFVAHLFGHMHEAASRVSSEGGAPPRRGFQGLSLFGTETLEDDKGRRIERLHGYAAMRIAVSGDEGVLTVWPRSLELNRVAEYRRMVPDHGRYDLDDSGALRMSFVPQKRFSTEALTDKLLSQGEKTSDQQGVLHRTIARRGLGIIALALSGVVLGGSTLKKFFGGEREKQHLGSGYEHFLALRGWQPAIEAGRTLGVLQGEVYCEIWTQRYADGIIIHPTRLEDWGGPPRPRDFMRSFFVLNSSRRWLGHIRPPIEGIYDRNVFAPIAASARLNPPYAGRLDPVGWPYRHVDWAAATPAESIFVPHCESQDRSLSGGFAVLIAQYNLQPILGVPIERQMVQVGLFRIYEGGYVICPMPPPPFDDGVNGVSVAQVSDNGRCRPQDNVLNSIYVLSRTHMFSDTDAATTVASSGGVAYESGHWRRIATAPPTRERELRPHRGFFIE